MLPKENYSKPMGFFGKLDFDFIINQLKIQSDPKKIEQIRALLRKNNFTDEDIDLRLSLIEEPSQSPDLGYKKGKGTFSSTAYALECNHMIRAKTATKSLNYLQGKLVFCEICKEQRRVVGRPRML